jgi:predicted amidohydrolase
MAKIGVLQMTSGIDPAVNAATLVSAIAEAAEAGASMLFTPEMSGLIDRDRSRAAASIVAEADDPVLAAVRGAAAQAGLWVHLGSLAVRALFARVTTNFTCSMSTFPVAKAGANLRPMSAATRPS